MLIPKVLDNRAKLMIAIAFAGWLTLLACTINTKDDGNGDAAKVDIQTPVGGLHVNEEADVRDTGLAVYPGARQKPKVKDGDSKSANVNIASSFFGLKVVAIEFEADDSPAKVIAFYQDQLKKFGSVVQCRTEKQVDDLSISLGDEGSKAVSCGGKNSGNTVELKVGTEDNQRLVSVEPSGKGSDFSLVFIHARGREGSI
jgi:hypothetical protein